MKIFIEKITNKTKELGTQLEKRFNDVTWKEIIAIWLTVGGSVAFCISLFHSISTSVSIELSILFEMQIVSNVLLVILAQLILLNERLKKK